MQRKGGQQPSQRLVNKTESYSHLTLVLDEKLDSLNGGSSRLGDGLFAMRKKIKGQSAVQGSGWQPKNEKEE